MVVGGDRFKSVVKSEKWGMPGPRQSAYTGGKNPSKKNHTNFAFTPPMLIDNTTTQNIWAKKCFALVSFHHCFSTQTQSGALISSRKRMHEKQYNQNLQNKRIALLCIGVKTWVLQQVPRLTLSGAQRRGVGVWIRQGERGQKKKREIFDLFCRTKDREKSSVSCMQRKKEKTGRCKRQFFK